MKRVLFKANSVQKCAHSIKHDIFSDLSVHLIGGLTQSLVRTPKAGVMSRSFQRSAGLCVILLMTFSAHTQAQAEDHVIDRYPASVSSGFLSSCEETSAGKSDYCACTFKKLQETMSFSEFSAAERRASEQGVVDPRLLAITSSCK